MKKDEIIKIFDDTKIWDADNRNVKLIQDGLIQGRVIKDDTGRDNSN